MILLLRNFVWRWKWWLLAQFVAGAACWIYDHNLSGNPDRNQPVVNHLELVIGVAMSWDLMRGVSRACLAFPMSRTALARGLWLAVAGIGPLVSCLAVFPSLVVGFLTGRPVPSWNEISLHMVLSFLLGGAIQFVLTGLPVKTSPTWPGKLRDMVFALMWGLSISSPGWLGRVIPAGWEKIHAGGWIALGLMAAAAVASWFTTPGMVAGRITPAASGQPARTPLEKRSSVENGRNEQSEREAFRRPGGWKVWLGLELRWMLFLPLMALVILGSLRLMGSFSSGGAKAAIESDPNRFSSLGALCSMMVIPMFSLSCGSIRAFAALPVRRDLYALLMALRPPVYCLTMFAAFVLLSWAMGSPVGGLVSAACAFALIGAVTSLLQPFLIRWPSFPAALGLGMLLTPATMLLLPVSLKTGMPLIWMPQLSVAFILISAALHRRFLRTSSTVYRSLPWMQRQPLAGTPR